MLFNNQNFDLMKKANFSLVVASVMFFFFAGVSAVSAQTSWESPLSAKDMDISGITLVSVDDAMLILTSAYKTLVATPAGTAAAEANQAARLAYYQYLMNALDNGQGIGDVLPYSQNNLLLITSRYQASIGVDPVAIYDETVQMLEQ
jgi:hypothetical protein